MVLERPIVLVVEDNKDIRDVLAFFLLEETWIPCSTTNTDSRIILRFRDYQSGWNTRCSIHLGRWYVYFTWVTGVDHFAGRPLTLKRQWTFKYRRLYVENQISESALQQYDLQRSR